jgi:hypothetical protein
MKINLDKNVLDFEGKPVLQGEDDGPKTPLAFRDVIRTAITMIPKGVTQTSEEKEKIFRLGIKLFSKKLKEYDLTTDQLSFLSKQIDMLYGALVVGRWKQLIGDLKDEDDVK